MIYRKSIDPQIKNAHNGYRDQAITTQKFTAQEKISLSLKDKK